MNNRQQKDVLPMILFLRKEEVLYFYGDHVLCEEMISIFKEHGLTLPIAIFNDDTEKHGTFIENIPVVDPKDMMNKGLNCKILVISKDSKDILISQAQKVVSGSHIIFSLPSTIKIVLSTYSTILQNEKQAKLLVELEEDILKYTNINRDDDFSIDFTYLWPVITDKYANNGGGGAYFWQDLWGAKKVFENNPKVHYDIGSSVNGFIAHLLSFRGNVNLIDIRPTPQLIPGVSFTCADATNLEGIRDNSIESLSALCSLEHFGLGRYGVPIDPDAYLKACRAIERVMIPGGDIYISVPVGPQNRVEFNAHRVYHPKTVVDSFPNMNLVEFSNIVSGKQEFLESIINYSGKSGTGLFHFRKK